jgi:hypothetical protein
MSKKSEIMKTTFSLSNDRNNPGRIANVVYQIEGELEERSVVTSPDENAYDAIRRDIHKRTGILLGDANVLIPGQQYEYTPLGATHDALKTVVNVL